MGFKVWLGVCGAERKGKELAYVKEHRGRVKELEGLGKGSRPVWLELKSESQGSHRPCWGGLLGQTVACLTQWAARSLVLRQ